MNGAESAFYSIIVVCFTLIVFVIIDRYTAVKEAEIKKLLGPVEVFEGKLDRMRERWENMSLRLSEIDSNKGDLYNRLDQIGEQIKDLPDYKSRIDTIAMKVGFKI